MFNKNKFLPVVILLLTVFFTNQYYASKEKLIVFHFDFNSVSLNKEYVYKWIDKAAGMGYNAILWEIEDDVEWETCKECVSESAFSKSEIKEIIKYSRSLGLEPIPLLQTIGHGEYVLQHEKYFSLREDSTRYDCYCTSNEDVKTFLKKWINEYLDLFGDLKYFHLGGDEAYAFATCDVCKPTAESVGENKLYADYLKEIAEPLLKNNIRPGIWGDMILSHPNDLDDIPKEFVIWDWNYWDGDSSPNHIMVWGSGRLSKENIPDSLIITTPEIIDNEGNLRAFYTSNVLQRNGFDVILCSTSRSHGDAVFAGRNNLHVDNIIGAARKTVTDNLLGTCVTSWAVRIPNYETQEPWFYLAPLTVKNSGLSKDELMLKASKDLFKYDGLELYKNFNRIGYSFPFANTNTTGIMWTGLKDSKPAPANYIRDLIERLKSRDRWNSNVQIVKKSTDSISYGLTELSAIIPNVDSGLEILNNWNKAGYFQYWQSILANEIVKKANDENGIDAKEILQLINSLKKEFAFWANDWMTEDSAILNTGLIYDSLENYFKNK